MWVIRMTWGNRSARLREQIDHGAPAILVQRAEDLVQDQQRQRLPGPLGDHLADGQPERQVGHVLLAAGDDRLGIAVVEQGGASSPRPARARCSARR